MPRILHGSEQILRPRAKWCLPIQSWVSQISQIYKRNHSQIEKIATNFQKVKKKKIFFFKIHQDILKPLFKTLI